MTSRSRRRFWIDPPLQLKMVATVMLLVAGSVFLVAYSVFHGIEEASLATRQIFHSLDWIRETIRGPIIVSASISLLACTIIALVWSHRFAGPLRVLAAAMERLSQGDLSVPVRIRKSDTHQELVQEFAKMQERLHRLLEADLRALKAGAAQLKGSLAPLPEEHEARKSAQALIKELADISSHYQL